MLPDTVLFPQPDKTGATVLPVPMLGANGEIYVVMTGEKPTVAAINAEGVVLSRVKLGIPDGYRLGEPRVVGERIVAEIAPRKFENSAHFVELNANDGELLFVHSVPQHAWKLTCQTESASIVALHNPNGSLDVLAASAKESAVEH